jgi:ATP-dependent DNA ligase
MDVSRDAPDATLTVGLPFSPMLAAPLGKLSAYAAHLDEGVWAAVDKFDGERLLVHVHRARAPGFTLTSRNMKDRSVYLPRFLTDIAPHIPAEMDNCVIDGELMGMYVERDTHIHYTMYLFF